MDTWKSTRFPVLYNVSNLIFPASSLSAPIYCSIIGRSYSLASLSGYKEKRGLNSGNATATSRAKCNFISRGRNKE
jgi:hypothetical protein